MFSRANNANASRSSALLSIIAPNCRVNGDIEGEGEIQIDGNLEGDIKAEIVVIGETGSIKGAITAKTVRVHGAVTGQITATEVELAKTAKVQGDIHHESLAVAAGAQVEGLCHHLATKGETIALPAPDAEALLPAGSSPALGT